MENKRDKQLMKLDLEIRALRQVPVFVQYMEMAKIMNEGSAVADAIQRKERLYASLASKEAPYSHLQQPQQEEQEEEMPEPPTPPRRMATQQMKQELKNRQPPTKERERELDKKVAMADSEDDFSVTPMEIGQDDDVELPDIEVEEE